METTVKLKLGFAALMIVSGIGVAMYPVVSNAVAQRHASSVIESYNDNVQSMDAEKIDAAKEAARRYNQQLNNAIDRDAAGEADDIGTSYVDMLDVGESLGYITIPKIDVNLPIYEGTSDDVLVKGVGHLEGSSYPLGGAGTHSVLTGHRGLAEAVLFTDLDKLGEGDRFYLHIMDEVLAYQVDQVKVVEPENTEDLEIIPGGDYCTLVTCTPYAINTHRMLVRGARVPYTGEDEQPDTPQTVQYQQLNTGNVVKRIVDAWPWISVTGSVVIGGEALLLLLLVVRRIRPREKYTAEEKRALLRGGLICGFFLTLGVNLQQFGIETTTAGKAGFITTLYIILVPVFSIMLGKKAKKSTWIYVLFAVAGLYFLRLVQQRRFLYFPLRLCLYRADPRGGSLCAAGGRHCAFLRAVRGGHCALDRRRARLRRAHHACGCKDLPSVFALCRRDVERRGLYAADPCAEGRRPDGRVAAAEPRVVFCRCLRRDRPARAHEPARVFRLRADACGGHPLAAAGEKRQSG